MDAAFVLFRTSLLIMDEAAGPGSGLASDAGVLAAHPRDRRFHSPAPRLAGSNCMVAPTMQLERNAA
jgi:hypothetical protein